MSAAPLAYLDEIYEELFGYGLEKTAAVKEKFKPFPHQRRAVDLFIRNDGQIIMAHGTGSGKTASAIFAFEAGRRSGIAKRALVVVPTGLRTNFSEKGVKKFTDDRVQVFGNKSEVSAGTHISLESADSKAVYSVVGYEMFRRNPTAYMKAAGADTIIADEVHKAKSMDGTTYQTLMTARAMARNFIGMTGSVVSNKPSDAVPLLNLAAGWPMAGTQHAFNRRYVQVVGTRKGFLGGKKEVKRVIRPEEIQQRFGKIVDFVSHDDLDPGIFPKKHVSEVLVEMNEEQKEIYNYAMKDVPPAVRKRIELNLPVGRKEAKHIFGMILQARQAANSIHTMKNISLEESAERTPKIKRVLDDAENHLKTTPDGQVVMYSNLVRGGIDVLSAGLNKRGIDYAVFVGKGRKIGGQKVLEQTRQQGVRDYLAGKKRVILVSGAGAEGLDLKNTTMVQMVDGHFNPEVTQQAEARGVRAKGLAHRAPEKRMVAIKRYKTVMPKVGFLKSLFGGKKKFTTDQWIYGVAHEKDNLNRQFRQALKTGGTPKFTPPKGYKPKRFKPQAYRPQRVRTKKFEPAHRYRPKKYKRRWRVWTTTGAEWRYEY